MDTADRHTQSYRPGLFTLWSDRLPSAEPKHARRPAHELIPSSPSGMSLAMSTALSVSPMCTTARPLPYPWPHFRPCTPSVARTARSAEARSPRTGHRLDMLSPVPHEFAAALDAPPA